LCGAVRPDEGDLFLDGQPARFNTPRQARSAGISVVYQDLALVEGRDVSHNMFLGTLPVRGPVVDRSLMDRVSAEIMGELAKNPPSVRTAVSLLSGGQRQLVAIGRAVRERSRLIFLDEPTAALGVHESQHVLEILRALRDNRGISIAVISHNLEHVFSLADRIVIMRRGRIVGERRRAESTTSDIVALITGAVGADVAP
jgi:ABC-type sugar transport system ATPase subunit